MSEPSQSLCIIIPAFNEAASLPGVIADLRRHVPDASIIVVDDGSTDNTAHLLREIHAQSVRLPFNLGIGGAVQTGLTYARNCGFDVAVQFDGDGQHRADQVSRLLEPLKTGAADVVIGSRFLEPSKTRTHFLKGLGMAMLRLTVSIAAGQRFTDTTSGFRAYRSRALAYLARLYPQDYPEPESTVDLCRAHFRVVEVPVTMAPRTAGRSSIGLRYSWYYMVKVLLSILVAGLKKPVQTEETPTWDCVSK